MVVSQLHLCFFFSLFFFSNSLEQEGILQFAYFHKYLEEFFISRLMLLSIASAYFVFIILEEGTYTDLSNFLLLTNFTSS